jgi:hypothetical protein
MPPLGSPHKKSKTNIDQHKKNTVKPYDNTGKFFDNNNICMNWNRQQCKEPCPGWRLHVCNVQVKGQTCGMRNHCALEHKPNTGS